MRSMSMWCLCFSLVIASQADSVWRVNTDVMDLAIGINRANTTTERPLHLVRLIKAMVGEFNVSISESKTRVAMAIFGGKNKTVLAFEQSVSSTNREDAYKELGNTNSYASYPTRPSYIKLAEMTREIFIQSKTSDRSNVPMVVVIFREVGADLQPGDAAAAREAVQHGAGVVVLNQFDSGSKYVTMAVFPTFGKELEINTETNNFEAVGKEVANMTRAPLQQCVYKELPKSACYVKDNRCLVNVTYETAFNGSGRPEKPPKRLEWFCFRNATIPCSSDKCRTTTVSTKTTTAATSSTTKPTTASRPTTGDKSFSSSSTASESTSTPAKRPNPRTTTKKTTMRKSSSTKKPSDGSTEGAVAPEKTDSAIAGIAIGVSIVCILLLLAAIALGIVFLRRRKKSLVERKGKGKLSMDAKKTAGKFSKDEKKSKGKLSMEKSGRLLSNRSQGPPQWSVTPPPDLSITPTDELIKQYYKKK